LHGNLLGYAKLLQRSADVLLVAYVAGITDKIRIGISVLVLPYRPAVVTAKQAEGSFRRRKSCHFGKPARRGLVNTSLTGNHGSAGVLYPRCMAAIVSA
jgi:hypothetical protein